MTLSSTEAEYVSASETGREVKYLRTLLEFLEQSEEGPTPVCMDSSPAIFWITDPVQHRRNKHLDVRYHHVRELQERKIIEAVKIPRDFNRADPLTHAVPQAVFYVFLGATMRDM